MEIAVSECVPITDASSVGEARRTGLLAAERLGLDTVQCGEFALLATEVSRNVLLHGGGGQTIIFGYTNHHGPVARILALDSGPGIANVTQAMEDGYSTAGTMGAGLGAIKRIANSMEIFTARNGTIVFVELAPPAPHNRFQIAGLAVPYPGERLCGDGWTYHQSDGRTLILLVDGLGHGPEAADAANEAIAVFRKRVDRSPAEILSYIHDALKKTRGAAGAIAEIRSADNTLTFAGVGNTVAVLMGARISRNLISHNGTLGMTTPKIQEFKVEWPEDGILVMHSDGVQSKWDLSSYSGLLARHAAVIGGALLRDFRRQRDDASVVVVKARS
jgi:anti-sigma regulatory factor (Ser/Thr protein kinase)